MMTVVCGIIYRKIAEGNIPHGGNKRIVLKMGLFKTVDLNCRLGIQLLCNSTGDAVQFHTGKMTILHTLRAKSQKCPDAAGRFQNLAGSDADPFQFLIHRTNHSRWRIESRQGRFSRSCIFFRGQQFLYLIIVTGGGFKNLFQTAPAHIFRQYLLFCFCCRSLFRFQFLQCADRKQIGFDSFFGQSNAQCI